MDPLKNYEYVQLDIFDIQINCLSKKLYVDKKIFDIIEDKVNEIKYMITGNKKYLKKNDQNNQTKYKFKSGVKKRFSIFKTPIVIANIPIFKPTNRSKSSIIKFNKDSYINNTLEELDENINESTSFNDNKINNLNINYTNKYNNEKILPKSNTNIITDDDISRSNILVNSPSIVENKNPSEMKKCLSDSILLINNDYNNEPINKSYKLFNNKKSTIHGSLLSFEKQLSLCDTFIKDKNDEKLISTKKQQILNNLITNDIKNIVNLKKEPFNKHISNNMYLTKSNSIRTTITSFKERLINKKIYDLEEKKEFIENIKKEVNIFQINFNYFF